MYIFLRARQYLAKVYRGSRILHELQDLCMLFLQVTYYISVALCRGDMAVILL